MASKKLGIDIFIFLLLGFSINFFSPKIINDTNVGLVRYAFILAAILLSAPYLLSVNYGLGKQVKWIFFAQLFSVLAAYYSWDQGIFQSLQASILLSLWPFFFYLWHIKYPLESIERIIMIYGVIYLICYAYQYMHSDTVLFGSQDEFQEDRGVTRIVFPGGGVLFLSAFIAINKVTGRSANKLLYVFFACAALAATILQVTRQNIVVLLFFYIYHLIRKLSPIKKVIILASIITGIILLLNSDNPIVTGLEEKQRDTAAEGQNYIRVLSGYYFLHDFAPDLFSRVVGNGAPYKSAHDASRYGDAVFNLTQTNGFYISDVGIIGFYVMFGIFAVFAYLLLLIKGVLVKVPDEYLYLKYYTWYIILTCLTSDGVYGANFLLSNIFVFYGLQLFCRGGEVPVDDEGNLVQGIV